MNSKLVSLPLVSTLFYAHDIVEVLGGCLPSIETYGTKFRVLHNPYWMEYDHVNCLQLGITAVMTLQYYTNSINLQMAAVLGKMPNLIF